LYAAVRCRAQERQRLEQRCRAITRPALASERLQINSAGQAVRTLNGAMLQKATDTLGAFR